MNIEQRIAEGLSIGIERAALRYIVESAAAMSALDPVVPPDFWELSEIVRAFNPTPKPDQKG